MFNVVIKDQRTGAKQIADTAPDAYSADRKASQIMRQLVNKLDPDHIAYIEPSDGWEAEAKRAAAIAADWEVWRKANGFEQRATDGGVKNG
jgi:hypothetical protein